MNAIYSFQSNDKVFFSNKELDYLPVACHFVNIQIIAFGRPASTFFIKFFFVSLKKKEIYME